MRAYFENPAARIVVRKTGKEIVIRLRVRPKLLRVRPMYRAVTNPGQIHVLTDFPCLPNSLDQRW
jgi:hypothetical protein